MTLLTELFQSTRPTFSLEVFPAKTPEGDQKLLKTLDSLCGLNPSFVSCTYGAGGSSRDKTFEIVDHIQTEHRIPAMAHLTCITHTRAEIDRIFAEFERRHIRNILALRGDPPQDGAAYHGQRNDFQYSSDLVALIRSRFRGDAAIGVAGFPEKHPLAPDYESDARFLKIKIDAGADFVITQLFFDNQAYFSYVDRLRKIGVKVPIIPGILPITDYEALKRFCARCGAVIPNKVHAIFAPIADDREKTLVSGFDFAIRQCRDLLQYGAPGIHFYTLNKVHPVDGILQALRS